MVNVRRFGLLPLVLLTVLLPWVAHAQEQRLIAEVDRPTVRENESFTYVLRAEGRFSGRPDLSALSQDFDVLDNFRSTSIQIVNGQTTQIAEWVVTLMPRQTGIFDLPAAELDGMLSNAVPVEVLPAAAANAQSDSIFIEVELERDSAYVQSEIIYTLRLFVGVDTGRATLTVPLIEGGEAIIEKLGQDREYEAIRGNTRYYVRERSYAIYPQDPGELSIGPVVYEAVVQQGRGLPQTLRLRSDVLQLEVRPAVPPPPEYPNAVWLPASALELVETWNDPVLEFSQGVPRTRTLRVTAAGLLDTQLPELDILSAPGLRQYPDQPEMRRDVTDEGIIATRIQRYAVIAQQPGDIELPAVELPWWNVDQERWEVARIESRNIAVNGTGVAEAGLSDPASSRTVVSTANDPGIWPWVSVVLAGGWLLTLVGWLYSQRRRPTKPAASAASRQSSGRQVMKQLIAACRVNDAQRARELLLVWSVRQFTESPPRSLGALAARLSGPLAQEIERLEATLYGPAGGVWQGSRLAELLQQSQSVARIPSANADDPLVSLYR